MAIVAWICCDSHTPCFESLTEDWLNVIKKREYIEDMCERGLSPKPSDELMNLKV